MTDTDDNQPAVLIDPAFNASLPINLTFYDDDRQEIGKFEYDRDTRLWNFTGDLAPAAKIFARSMYLQFEYMLEETIQKRASLIAEANVEGDDG